MADVECLLIGIDGLDPELVDDWRADLPTLSGLIERGQFGRLESTYPPLSSPAWPTINTGKQGGKHGVFSFSENSDDAHDQLPLNFDDINAETIWEAADAAGIPTGVVNVPMTYPPTSLDHGYVIAGWPAPNRGEIAAPASVLETVESETGEQYRINPFPVGPERQQMSNEEILDVMIDGLWHHHRAFRALLSAYDVELFYCMYDPIDPASHHLARDRPTLKRLYEAQDEAVRELIAAVDTDPNIVLVSDHGHCARGDLAFKTNEWLAAEGYLTLDEESSAPDRERLFTSLGLTRGNLMRLKRALGIGHVRSKLPQFVIDALAAVFPPQEDVIGFDAERIDWDETTAFSSMQNLVFLNDDRYHGTVADAEKDDLREQLREDLQAITHPRSDSPLMTYVYTRDEIFEGPYLDDAPDLVFVADEMRCACHTGFNDGEVFADHEWGEHRQHGVCLTAGPAFSAGEDSPDRSVEDVFPLVAATLGISVPADLDGTVPDERFQTAPTLDTRESRDADRQSTEYTADEISAVEEQLEGLGYLE